MAEILMVLAPNDFRDEEFFEPKAVLEEAEHHVVVTSLADVAVSAVEHKEVITDLLLDQVDVADYDAVVFVGGDGATCYFDHEKASEMSYQTVEQGKILGAICIAPGILARAGVLEGKKATCYATQKEVLEEHGALYVDSHVAVDGNIITADGPSAAKAFGEKIVEALASA